MANADDTDLPERTGERPATTNGAPHQQTTQNPDRELYDRLADALFDFPAATEQPSKISVPGARALILDDDVAAGPDAAFMTDREFCHLHPPYDGSLHACLPAERVEAVIDAGWGELHPLAAAGRVPATRAMLYGPRDASEIEALVGLATESYRFAGGSP